jgi:hypothetical protein
LGYRSAIDPCLNDNLAATRTKISKKIQHQTLSGHMSDKILTRFPYLCPGRWAKAFRPPAPVPLARGFSFFGLVFVPIRFHTFVPIGRRKPYGPCPGVIGPGFYFLRVFFFLLPGLFSSPSIGYNPVRFVLRPSILHRDFFLLVIQNKN